MRSTGGYVSDSLYKKAPLTSHVCCRNSGSLVLNGRFIGLPRAKQDGRATSGQGVQWLLLLFGKIVSCMPSYVTLSFHTMAQSLASTRLLPLHKALRAPGFCMPTHFLQVASARQLLRILQH